MKITIDTDNKVIIVEGRSSLIELTDFLAKALTDEEVLEYNIESKTVVVKEFVPRQNDLFNPLRPFNQPTITYNAKQ